MSDDGWLHWKCTYPGCNETLNAVSERGLEVIKQMHGERHGREIILARDDFFYRLTTDDIKFLTDIGIDPRR